MRPSHPSNSKSLRSSGVCHCGLFSYAPEARPLEPAASLHSLAQKVEQRQFQGPLGAETMIGNPKFLTHASEGRAMGLQSIGIIFARRSRINEQNAFGFHILEHRGPVEIK